MNQSATEPAKPQPRKGSHLMDEPDIGSGEKTPGERETEEHIRQVPPLPDKDGDRQRSDAPPGKA